MVSAITERPYTFLRWLTGTLPGRKPLRRTLSLRSIRRASALASRSDAGTLIWNSCFNPSARVSVTCMASIFFPLGPAKRRDIVNLIDARVKACVGGSAYPILQGKLTPLEIGSPGYRDANAVSAWCGRRDSNPHNFRHWNLNPARLPVPPRPLIASYPVAMPEHDAEKCEAVFGRPSCSKLLESITVMLWMRLLQSITVMVAA